jgi:hypothetical protein
LGIVNRKLLPPHLRRIVVACVLLAALLMLPLPASAGPIWNIGAGIGYLALVAAVVLYLYPLRAHGVPHRRLFALSQHRRIGWIALYIAGLHAAILLAAQPLIGHYLLPSAPLYMLCGLAAFIALAVLVATGISARSALRRAASPRESPASVTAHAVLAALLPALLGAHVIGSGQLVDRPAKIIAGCALLALAVLGYAFRPGWARIRARLLSTVVPCSIAAVVLLALPTPTGGSRLLQPATAPLALHVNFPHENHRTVNCITCHHNFVDHTGFGSCLDCHRSPRPDLRQSGEATFHVFCRDCHRDLALQGSKHGPVRECSACHEG